MPTRVHTVLRLLALVTAIASVWARHGRPTLAWSLAIIAFAAFVTSPLMTVIRLARTPERPPGLLRRTSVSLGLSALMMAWLLFVRWTVPLAASASMLAALFVVELRRRSASAPTSASA